jgi:hypothetical protein
MLYLQASLVCSTDRSASHYNPNMHLLIPGALPPSNVAKDLLPQVEQHCPALVERLKTLVATVQELAPEHTGCTPFEAVRLQQLGYTPPAGANLGTGLAALRAGVKNPAETVWLAELSAISVGREGATIAHPASFELTTDEADALFDSVSGLWADRAISALPLNNRQWRIWLDPSASTRSLTPAAMAEMRLTDWWPQEDSLREWRRLLNEIQMVWHEHPVNLARTERGELPINSLWLFGGAQGWSPTQPAVQAAAEPRNRIRAHQDPLASSQTQAEDLSSGLIYEGLHTPYLQGDWAAWIAALPALSEHLSTLERNTSLTLTGQQRCVILTPARKRWWHALIAPRPQSWNTWWNLPN